MNYSRVSYESYHITLEQRHSRPQEVEERWTDEKESQMRFVYHRVLHKIKLHEMNTTSFANLETNEVAIH